MYAHFLGPWLPLQVQTVEVQGFEAMGFTVYVDDDARLRLAEALRETRIEGRFKYNERPGVMRLQLSEVAGLSPKEVIAELHDMLIKLIGDVPLTYCLHDEDSGEHRFVRQPDGTVQDAV